MHLRGDPAVAPPSLRTEQNVPAIPSPHREQIRASGVLIPCHDNVAEGAAKRQAQGLGSIGLRYPILVQEQHVTALQPL